MRRFFDSVARTRRHSGGIPCLCGAALIALATTAHAFDLTGRIVNGTTGEKNVNIDVLIVNPSAGMAPEQTVRAENGRFTISGLSAKAPIYLVRVDYKGVVYSEPVRPTNDDIEVVVMIYEPTSSWDEVRVSIPHIVATRHSDHLEIEQLYEINNVSNPPRAIAGGDHGFRYRIPLDKLSITALYVTALGIPVERSPEPTDDPGIYRVSYPIRPGITRVGVSYTLPYDEGTYTLSGTFLYDIDRLVVYGVDPAMTITGENITLVSSESAHDMTAWTATDIARGTEIAITFTGGSGRSSAPSSSAGTGTVMIVPNEMEDVSLMVMFVVLLALGAFVGISIRGGESPLCQPSRIRAYYEVLLRRLARLDDLRHTEVISDEVHRAQREELKGRLASLMYQLRSLEPDARARYVGPPTNPPTSPGEEQRSAS
ncbi:MAG: hypothetical protein IH969_09255 [Candidatus Krumholzibacteriota bacterium]|nr:hypothetical protein [Candidatus Krumholzibacteriota bacterium]